MSSIFFGRVLLTGTESSKIIRPPCLCDTCISLASENVNDPWLNAFSHSLHSVSIVPHTNWISICTIKYTESHVKMCKHGS